MTSRFVVFLGLVVLEEGNWRTTPNPFMEGLAQGTYLSAKN